MYFHDLSWKRCCCSLFRRSFHCSFWSQQDKERARTKTLINLGSIRGHSSQRTRHRSLKTMSILRGTMIWLEGEISTRRAALDDQRQVLINKEAALTFLDAYLNKIVADNGQSLREKKNEEKLVKKAISERKLTVVKMHEEIKDKQRALKGLEDELADLKEKVPTPIAIRRNTETFAHKKFRHEERGLISELKTELKAKDAVIQSLQEQLAALKAKKATAPASGTRMSTRLMDKKRKREEEEESLETTTTTMNKKQKGECSTSKEGQEVDDKQEGTLKGPFVIKDEEEEGSQSVEASIPQPLVFPHSELEAALNKAKDVFIVSMQRELDDLCSKYVPEEGMDDNSQCEEVVFAPDPVELALGTPVILKEILEKLDNRSLASCRLVSIAWNTRALKLFSQTAQTAEASEACDEILDLNKLLSAPASLPAFDPQLVKSIHFNDTGDTCPCTRAKFLEFVAKFSPNIEHIVVKEDLSSAYTLLNKILDSYAFPMLKTLKFVYDDIQLKGWTFVGEMEIDCDKMDNMVLKLSTLDWSGTRLFYRKEGAWTREI